MGKDKQMAEYLCETCKYRNGDLRPYHTYDSCGVKYSYTGAKKVNCTASKKHPGRVVDAVRDTSYDPWQLCISYRKRGK